MGIPASLAGQSQEGWVGIPACLAGQSQRGGVWSQGGLQFFGGSPIFRDGGLQFFGGVSNFSEYGQRSAGTHPTGMHSCF